MNKVILTTNTLRNKFRRVETIYGLVINAHDLPSHILKLNLQTWCDSLAWYQKEMQETDCSPLGEMYKAGIIEGCNKALNLLKTEFNVEPNK